jgi:membrane protein
VLELKTKKDKVIGFFATDLWKRRLGGLSGGEALYLRSLRVVVLSGRGFLANNDTLRASALTFYSLLGIVPVLAIAFGIATGFGLKERLHSQLLGAFSGQEEVIARVIDFADKLLASTRGGLVAGVGVAVLFWTVIKVFGHIEEAFNVIWEAREKRPIGRRFSNYLTIMLIAPVVVIISGGVTIFISAQVTSIIEKVGFLVHFGPAVFLVLKLLPYALIWLLLAFVYITMPNTDVRFKPGFLGAVVAGTMYQSVQWVYITFQIGIAKYNAVYGSFAALPMFLVWLNLSWLIVLFGAELSCAIQNVEGYDLDPMVRRASPSTRKRLSLLITHLVVKEYVKGTGPVKAAEISKRLGLPTRLAKELTGELVEAGILSEGGGAYAHELNYQPRLATETITIGSVLDALDARGTEELPLPETEEVRELTAALTVFRKNFLRSSANRPLREI